MSIQAAAWTEDTTTGEVVGTRWGSDPWGSSPWGDGSAVSIWTEESPEV